MSNKLQSQPDEAYFSIYPSFSQEFEYDPNSTGRMSSTKFNNAGAEISNATYRDVAVIDEFGYYLKTGSTNEGRHAWSLTKITVPQGGSATFEYEPDQSDLDGDRIGWKTSPKGITDQDINFISQYNLMALVRSIHQSEVNKSYPQGSPQKLRYRTFAMMMSNTSGGIRVKSKLLDDKINSPQLTSYFYGTGHNPYLPIDYISTTTKAFSKFMLKEANRHKVEIGKYNSMIPVDLFDGNHIATDFDIYMAGYSVNAKFDHTSGNSHYYEYIDEVTNADNSKIRFTYGDPKDPQNVKYYNQVCQNIKGDVHRDKLVTAITRSLESDHEVDLLSRESFDGSGISVEKSEFVFDKQILNNDLLMFDGVSFTETVYPTYVTGDKKINLYNVNLKDNIIFSADFWANNPFKAALNDAITIFTTGTFNSNTSAVAEYARDLGYKNITESSYKYEPSMIVRYEICSSRLTYQKSTKKGLENRIDYTYLTNNLLKTKKVSGSTRTVNGSSDNQSITEEMIYAYEAYPVLVLKNMLSQQAGVIVYNTSNSATLNSTKVMKANVTSWQNVSGNFYPYQKFAYRASINANGELVSFSSYPYSAPLTASPNWLLQSTISTYNTFGQIVANSTNSVTTKRIIGYNSEVAKATVNWTGGDFDATYTGFEDLNDLTYIDNYSQNRGRITLAKPPAALYCDYYDGYANSGIVIHINNTIAQLKVGDEVEILPDHNIPRHQTDFYDVNHPIFRSKIRSISINPNYSPYPPTDRYGTNVSNNNSAICFEDVLPSYYTAGYLTSSEIFLFSKKKYTPPTVPSQLTELWYDTYSGTTASYLSSNKRRTGSYSYALPGNQVIGASVTPIRPVIISSSNNVVYKVSFWMTASYASGQSTGGDVSVAYKVWNSSRTTVIASGQIPMNIIGRNLANGWERFETSLNIPIMGSGDRQVDVSIVNNTTNASSTPDVYYVDDLIITPEGAMYSYSSFDKFRNPLSVTDNNENTVKMLYDYWGRLTSTYDAKGKVQKKFVHAYSQDFNIFQSYENEETYINDGQFNEKRTFLDGFGQTRQIITTIPASNMSICLGFDIDSRGRVSKSYNPVGFAGIQKGINGGQKMYIDWASEAIRLYNNSMPYTKTEYYDEPIARVKNVYQPGTATLKKSFNNMANVSTDYNYQQGSSTITYPVNQLFKEITTDEKGNSFYQFKDKLGKLVYTLSPIGKDYSFDNGGEIVINSSSTEQVAKTYYFYDMAGNLIKVVDPEGKITTYTYNSLGQLITENHPDKGLTENCYDQFGRLRFTRDAKDLNSTYKESLTYYKFDKWNHIIETGKIKYPLGGAMTIFTNPTCIETSTFPSSTTNPEYVEMHKRYTYGDDIGLNTNSRLLKEEVFSLHTITAGIIYPGTTDYYEYKYDANGRVVEKKMALDGMNDQIFKFDYNNIGLLTSKMYVHPTNAQYNFGEFFEYDDLGRLVKTSSGNSSTNKKTDSKYKYDALGNLQTKYLGQKALAGWDQFQEYINYSYNVKNQNTELIAKNFKMLLHYDDIGNIKEQWWNNSQLDNTGFGAPGVNYDHHIYRYFYDKLNRLSGANYLHATTENDPYVNVILENITTEKEVKTCIQVNPPPRDYEYVVQHLKGLIFDGFKDYESYNGLLIGDLSDEFEAAGNYGVPLQFLYGADGIINQAYEDDGLTVAPDRAEHALEMIGSLCNVASQDVANANTIYTSCMDIIESENQDDAKINQLYQMLVSYNPGELNSIEGIYTLNTANDIKYQMLSIVGQTDMSSSEKFSFMKIRLIKFKGNIDILNALWKAFWDYYNSHRGLCYVRIESTTQNRLRQEFVNVQYLTPDRVYDCEYYYDKTGNTTQINRYDNSEVLTNQIHSYTNNTNKLIQSQISSGGSPVTANYNYDLVGNLVNDYNSGVTNITYNGFHNLPTTISLTSGPSQTYRYDANEQRVVKKNALGISEYNLGFVILDNNGVPIRYSITDGYVVKDINTGQLSRKYTITDWQGTVRSIIEGGAGSVVSARDHYPYGKQMPARTFESDLEGKRYQYTEHEFDEETQFEYHGARYYNREIGRYMSVDPMASKFPSWNAYNYTFNNPIMLIDPDGRSPQDIIVTTRAGDELFRLDDGKKEITSLTVDDLYKLKIQWFEPLADNYMPLLSIHKNLLSTPAVKHFTWDQIADFSGKSRSMYNYASGLAGDWKTRKEGGGNFQITEIGGQPFWTDAIGQIPFAVDLATNYMAEGMSNSSVVAETLKQGRKHGNGQMFGGSPDVTNGYDNYFILRAAVWATQAYKTGPRDYFNNRYKMVPTGISPNRLGVPLGVSLKRR